MLLTYVRMIPRGVLECASGRKLIHRVSSVGSICEHSRRAGDIQSQKLASFKHDTIR